MPVSARAAEAIRETVVAGFFLMLPLGSLYGLLKWPTFHGWGLMHGSYLSAWPTSTFGPLKSYSDSRLRAR
jgi:hypothetical protein